MKNQKLQMMFSQMKNNSEKDIEVLSSNDELSLLGGSCPVLMTCGTYTSCATKFKDGNRDTDIKLPDLSDIIK